MKASDLRNMGDAELQKQLDDLHQTLFNLRFQQTSGQLPNTNKLSEVKRDIARVKTLMRERELAVQRGAAPAEGKVGQ